MPKFLRRSLARSLTRSLAHSLARSLFASALALGLAAGAGSALAQSQVSDASLLSALPIASTAVASSTLLVAGASFGVAAVQTSAEGMVWVLERAADGQRVSLHLAQAAAGAASMTVGSVVVVTVIGTGWLLSSAGRLVAFVPNASGSALLYSERVTR